MFDSLGTPDTVALQAPLSMGFSRQEYWSALPFPSPGDLPVPGIEVPSRLHWRLMLYHCTTSWRCFASLGKGCVHLFYSQVGRDKLSLPQLNKGILVYSQAEGQGPPGKPLSMIIIIKASQRNSFQQGVRIDFLPAAISHCQSPFHSLVGKGSDDISA